MPLSSWVSSAGCGRGRRLPGGARLGLRKPVERFDEKRACPGWRPCRGTLGSDGGRPGRRESAEERTGPLAFQLHPAAVPVSRTAVRPASSPPPVHCRPFRAEKWGSLCHTRPETGPTVARRLSAFVRWVPRQRRPSAASHVLLSAGTV